MPRKASEATDQLAGQWGAQGMPLCDSTPKLAKQQRGMGTVLTAEQETHLCNEFDDF